VILDDPSPTLGLRLYVAGDGPNSMAALANLKATLARFPAHTVELEIIDVVVDPQRGRRDEVLVTPMLVKYAPVPTRRVVGSLRDQLVLLGALGLAER
jgi:circadian clock protein KaiB